jgi:hypothetical protein
MNHNSKKHAKKTNLLLGNRYGLKLARKCEARTENKLYRSKLEMDRVI